MFCWPKEVYWSAEAEIMRKSSMQVELDRYGGRVGEEVKVFQDEGGWKE